MPDVTSSRGNALKTVLSVIVVVIGLGMYYIGEKKPEVAKKMGMEWLTKPSKFAKDRTDNEYYSCRLDARRSGEIDIMNPAKERYEYLLECRALQTVVLSDLRVSMDEIVTSKNTGVGKTERSRRNLDSSRPLGDGELKLEAGKDWQYAGKLTVPSHAINTSGRTFVAEASVRYPDEAKKIDVIADRDRNPSKYRLKLEATRN